MDKLQPIATCEAFRVIDRRTDQTVTIFNHKRPHEQTDFRSVEAARDAQNDGLLQDKGKFRVAKYGVFYELINSDTDGDVEGVLREPSDTQGFEAGQLVSKTGSDYKFDGTVVSAFRKLPYADGSPGPWRYVVQDDRGILHIFGPRNLAPRP